MPSGTIKNKLAALLKMGKPPLLVLFWLTAFLGASFSPNFLSESFPRTFLMDLFSSHGVYVSKQWFSLIHAVMASFAAILIWLGTAIFNDYYDMEIDRRINPDRPLPKGEVSSAEAIFSASCAFVMVLILAFLEGDWICKLTVCLFILIGIEYSAPPLRLRKWGSIATLVIGVGIIGSILGGSMSQYSISAEGMVVAIILGALAVASSSIKDYKDIEGDLEAGVKTWPIKYGYDRSVDMNMAAVGVCYGLCLIPYVLGYFIWYSAPLVILAAIFNMKFLRDLKLKKDLASRRKIYVNCLLCFFGVVFVYALARFL